MERSRSDTIKSHANIGVVSHHRSGPQPKHLTAVEVPEFVQA
jgi:hypothetical protein